MKNKCDNYSETSGCLITFNGEWKRFIRFDKDKNIIETKIAANYHTAQEEENIAQLIDDLYNQALKDYDVANSKLERIKENCLKTIALMNEDSSSNPYAGGRCIEAGNVLQIMDEDER